MYAGMVGALDAATRQALLRIVLALAARLELIEPDLAQFMLIVAGLTMLATPLVAAGAARVFPAVQGAVEVLQ